jgi:hypothetical protein
MVESRESAWPVQDTDDQGAYFFSLADAAMNLEILQIRSTLVRHATGGGEVERYTGRHGTRRVAGAGPSRRSAADDAQVRDQSGSPSKWADHWHLVCQSQKRPLAKNSNQASKKDEESNVV